VLELLILVLVDTRANAPILSICRLTPVGISKHCTFMECKVESCASKFTHDVRPFLLYVSAGSSFHDLIDGVVCSNEIVPTAIVLLLLLFLRQNAVVISVSPYLVEFKGNKARSGRLSSKA
jgi:hypothetical protein